MVTTGVAMPVPGLASVTLSIGTDDPELPLCAAARISASIRKDVQNIAFFDQAAEAARIGLVSQVTTAEDLLGTCYDIAAWITGWSRLGVELAKRLLWSGLDAASLEAHMRHEGVAQLYLRNLTGNFEEMIRARKDHRTPVYLDDTRQKDP